MLQNRVDPAGNIIKTPERDMWMGNRGIIHNDKQEIVRPFKLHAWITCRLAFKGRKLQIMAPGHYTQLFFMDEATAFAAGHRPCAECRRDDYNRFKDLWLKGNPGFGFNKKTRIQDIDNIVQKERIGPGGSKITYQERPEDLPDGAFVLHNNEPYLLYRGRLYHWSPAGYEHPVDLPHAERMTVLTPGSIINTFNAGYKPQIGTIPDDQTV